jgi:hypothetical protein
MPTQAESSSPEMVDVTVPLTALEDPEGFEDVRKAIYQETEVGSEERGMALLHLIGNTVLTNGDSLEGEVLDVYTTPEDQRRARAQEIWSNLVEAVLQSSATKKPEAGASGVQVIMNLNGTPKDVLHIDAYKRDKSATDRAQAMSKRVPSGPKQNGLSGGGVINRDAQPGKVA